MRPDTERQTELEGGRQEEPALRLWRAYLEATRPSWVEHPVLLAAGFSIVLYPRLPASILDLCKWYYRSARALLRFLGGRRVGPVSVPECPVLLYASTNKPSFMPATEELARRLAVEEITSAIATLGNMRIVRGGRGEGGTGTDVVRVPAYERWMRQRLKAEPLLRVFADSLRATWVLLGRVRGNRALLLHCLVHVPQVWFDLFISLHRFYVVDQLLRECKPRFVMVNHERLPIAAELVVCANVRQVHTVLFTNEWPTVELIPILSREVWMWNERAMSMLKQLVPPGEAHAFSAIGIPELDFVLDPVESPSLEEAVLRKQVGGRPVVLFLSQAVPGRVESRVTEVILSWLVEVAEQCPEWHVVYKSRPGRQDSTNRQLDRLCSLANVSKAGQAISLRQLLRWEQVKVVCALNSSGLMIAVGTGKIVCRFVVPGHEAEYPLLSEVSVPIQGAGELVKLLRSDAREQKGRASVGLFPYQGETMKRMEELCLSRLRDLQHVEPQR